MPACAFDQAARIGNRAFGQAQRKRMFADAVEDRVALGDRQAIKPRVMRSRSSTPGLSSACAPPRRDAWRNAWLPSAADREAVRTWSRYPACRRARSAGHRDHLVGQCLIDGREPVESETADHLAQGGPLDDQRKQRETRGENADQTLDLDRDRRVFGDRQRQRQASPRRASHPRESPRDTEHQPPARAAAATAEASARRGWRAATAAATTTRISPMSRFPPIRAAAGISSAARMKISAPAQCASRSQVSAQIRP